jgi:hypothetical protein
MTVVTTMQNDSGVSRRAITTIAVAIIALALVVAAGWWMLAPGAPPPADGDPIKVAQFASTSRFDRLPESQKRPYMAALRKSADALKQARDAGKLSEHQYEIAKENVWLERQLDHRQDYFKHVTPQQKQAFLDELVAKKFAGKRPTTGAAHAAAPLHGGESADSPYVESRKARWPADQQEKWKEFRNALATRERAKGF